MIPYTENAKELATILITSFQDLPEDERFILSNNTFMVASQIKQTFGESITEKMQTFSNEDWRSAWSIFNGHYYDENHEEEGESEDEAI